MAYDMTIGAQLYTVHDYTKTLEGFAEALKKLPTSDTPLFRFPAPALSSPNGCARN